MSKKKFNSQPTEVDMAGLMLHEAGVTSGTDNIVKISKEDPKPKKSPKSKKADSWERFAQYAEEYYQKNKKGGNDVSKGIQIWVEDDIRDALAKIQCGVVDGHRIPIRHLASAAIRMVLEDNHEHLLEAVQAGQKKTKFGI